MELGRGMREGRGGRGYGEKERGVGRGNKGEMDDEIEMFQVQEGREMKKRREGESFLDLNENNNAVQDIQQ